ncbi:hypothetical protein MHLP_02240 [Candidatus Mycoplasma haematolamae str. Purdue]|uniref:Uncharacterized protein n=1 Tax=Mycoplasma haematolamae (strain Purdue) TaxID=1212765 RepID=I7BJJ2_MYCHA|nr:hypothetical protein [Candidatus Mycoplasma haematolamae]AFO52028.1 hypothetical protein MHLP_02240 [Candidatus Mycoplasma haematolamae str. Purdue]
MASVEATFPEGKRNSEKVDLSSLRPKSLEEVKSLESYYTKSSSLWEDWIKDWDDSSKYTEVYWSIDPKKEHRQSNLVFNKRYKGQWYSFKLCFNLDEQTNTTIHVGTVWSKLHTSWLWSLLGRYLHFSAKGDYDTKGFIGGGLTTDPISSSLNAAFRNQTQSSMPSFLRYVYLLGAFSKDSWWRELLFLDSKELKEVDAEGYDNVHLFQQLFKKSNLSDYEGFIEKLNQEKTALDKAVE